MIEIYMVRKNRRLDINISKRISQGDHMLVLN